MLTKFYFQNFEPSPYVQECANFSIRRVLDSAPYGSTGVVLIEKQENDYRCSVDISSVQGPFATSAVRSSATEAIRAVELKLKGQIQKWNQNRRQYGLSFLEVAT